MKKIIILFLAVLPSLTYSQTRSCCAPSANMQFVQMASSETFASAHLSPAPLNFVAERGTMIELECSDGKKGNAFLVKADSTTNNWLFVFHEWWGLNDYIKREAERLAGELRNVNVIAIDLYDGQVADKSENAQKIMQSIKDDRARALINGAIAHAGKDAKIGTIGWCFGGGWSLQASIMAGKQAVACVMYYGFPETDTTKLKKLEPGVLGIFALKDNWITPQVVSTFEKNMKALGKRLIVKTFDADHAFANPSNPQYDKEATKQANQLSMAYLKSKLH